jgi:hypothetical protein
MSRFACVWWLLLLAVVGAHARHLHHSYDSDESVLTVGGLRFEISGDWQPQAPETSARAGQWTIPPPDGPPGDGVEVVAFFFGPGVGGTAQQNIDGWADALTTPDGHPVTAAPTKRTVAGHAITEVLLTGTYAQTNPQPGLPPTPKPGYALLGAVIENPGGNIYWRLTGPVAQITALAPVVDRMIAGLRSLPPAAPAPPP